MNRRINKKIEKQRDPDRDKRVQKDEEDALWSDNESQNSKQENNPFDDVSGEDNNDDIFKQPPKDFGARFIQEGEEDDEPESLMIPDKRMSSPVKQAPQLSSGSPEGPAQIVELNEKDEIPLGKPVNDYYQNKNKLLRIFQNKKKTVRKRKGGKQNYEGPLDKVNNQMRVKTNSLDHQTRPTESSLGAMTQIVRKSNDVNLEKSSKIEEGKEESKNSHKEESKSDDEYADFIDSDNDKDTGTNNLNELFHDFDEKQLDSYDAEEVREFMEINKINTNKTSEENDSGFSLFSEEMLADIKNLLYLFGIPYIDAPFEAESQCAYLEQIGQVDGVVTQDSDVFLFGSRNVYKDIFEQNKFVEYYSMSNVEDEVGLDRD